VRSNFPLRQLGLGIAMLGTDLRASFHEIRCLMDYFLGIVADVADEEPLSALCSERTNRTNGQFLKGISEFTPADLARRLTIAL
jgi:hypothetical protein